MPGFTQRKYTRVDKKTDRQVGEMFNKVFKCHPEMKKYNKNKFCSRREV